MSWGIITTIADVIVTIISILQAMVSCYILVLVSIIVIYIGNVVDSIDKYVSIVDFIMGTDLSDQINGVAGLFKFLVMSIVVGQFIVCVLLCKGLCEKKPWLILPYIICGGFLFGVRVRLIIKYGDHDESQKEDSLRFCYGYGSYLLYLFLHCVEHVHKKKRQQKSLVL